jgi:hypothetical protein
MKRILNVVVLMLAVNFAAVAGGIGWLASTGHLTKERMAEVRKVLFPPPATQPATAAPATPAPPPGPDERLGDLAARVAAMAPADRVLAVQQAHDATLAELDDRRRELVDLRAQVELARQQVASAREAVAQQQATLAAEQNRRATADADKGFQDSLALYKSLPPKQVKDIFATLPDETVQRYLQAMDGRQSAKVMKEYKSPADVARLQRVLERIRAAGTTQPAPTDAAAAPDAATASVPPGR